MSSSGGETVTGSEGYQDSAHYALGEYQRRVARFGGDVRQEDLNALGTLIDPRAVASCRTAIEMTNEVRRAQGKPELSAEDALSSILEIGSAAFFGAQAKSGTEVVLRAPTPWGTEEISVAG